mmetsp:Transcript_28778/g.52069  ORF Transcript_28778/g.52069 Transcript_28778/m.52069 type:complete len:231 (+) Transcript_28778:98-790(+)
MTNVRGTGWDWPRNKFSLPSGVRGRRKHTRLPKNKDSRPLPRRIHQRQQKGQKGETRTPRSSIIVLANPNHRKSSAAKKDQETTHKATRRSNMEIGRARTPTIISSNASHIIPPANKSTKRFVRKFYLQIGCTKHERVLSNEALPTVRPPCITSTFGYSPFLPKRYGAKRVPNISSALMKIPGYSKTKGAVSKGDIFIIIILVRRRKSEQEEKGCWRQKINYNMTRERVC